MTTREKDEDERSLKEKRQDAAHASHEVRRAANYHPLFDYLDGENAKAIAWINLRRYEAGGPVDSLRLWPSDEIESLESIFMLFGGGTYELLGRAAGADGKAGAIVKRKTYRIPGPSKPLVIVQPSEEAEHAPMNGAGQASKQQTTQFDFMMQMMLEDRREARARDDRRAEEQRAADERRQARDEQRASVTMQIFAQCVTTVAGIASAIIAKPQAPSGTDALIPVLTRFLPDPGTDASVAKLQQVVDVAEKLAGKGKESIAEIVSAAAGGLQAMAQLEANKIEAAKHGLVAVQVQTAAQPQSQPPPAPATVPTNGTHARVRLEDVVEADSLET